jgi:hypothetical protein
MSRDREDYDPLDEVDDRRERGGSRRERSRSKDRWACNCNCYCSQSAVLSCAAVVGHMARYMALT